MDYELLFLDMDGTLKQEPDDISDTNKEAILKACKAGKKITITSGRNKHLILPTVKELQLDTFSDSYTIALNGAHIIKNNTGATLHSVPISMELTRRLLEASFELNIHCHIYTENYLYANFLDDIYEWYESKGCISSLVDMKRSDLGMTEQPLKAYIQCDDQSKLAKYKEAMSTVVEGVLSAEYSSLYSLEYTSVDASKGLGVAYVCKQLGMPIEKAIAAGDAENDISMIQMAGLGVAMKNALDSVKAIADTVTERTCKEDGVTEIIHKYLLA